MQKSGGPSCEPGVAVLRTVFLRRTLCEKNTNYSITLLILQLRWSKFTQTALVSYWIYYDRFPLLTKGGIVRSKTSIKLKLKLQNRSWRSEHLIAACNYSYSHSPVRAHSECSVCLFLTSTHCWQPYGTLAVGFGIIRSWPVFQCIYCLIDLLGMTAGPCIVGAGKGESGARHQDVCGLSYAYQCI